MGCIGRYTTLCQNWSHRAFIEVFPFCRGDSKYSPLHLSPLGIQVILVFKTSSFKEYLWNEIPQQDMSKDKINNNSAISSTLYWWKKKSVSLTYPVYFGSLLPIYIYFPFWEVIICVTILPHLLKIFWTLGFASYWYSVYQGQQFCLFTNCSWKMHEF